MKTKIFFISLLALSQLNQAFAAHNIEEKIRSKAEKPFIHIVGSSTISPLMAAVAEDFSRIQSEKGSPITTPVINSTGTKTGFKLFCGGVGEKYPDFVNASRPIDAEEIAECHKNKIDKIGEIKIGYDGIILGNFASNSKIKLTKEHIFLALAQKVLDKKNNRLVKNYYETWNQIDEKLPNTKIIIYGPPLSSGTRDVFSDMVMEEACIYRKEFVEAFKDEHLRKDQCHKMRNDEHFIEMQENDNVIVDNLKNDHDAFGILGFNFVANNKNIIQATEIDGVAPSFKTIASKKYPLSRPLFVYFKKEHLDLAPKMREFIVELTSSDVLGAKGYLLHNGLVPLDNKELLILQKNIKIQLKK
jgi:phosphate transport system substrate-binding protein